MLEPFALLHEGEYYSGSAFFMIYVFKTTNLHLKDTCFFVILSLHKFAAIIILYNCVH